MPDEVWEHVPDLTQYCVLRIVWLIFALGGCVRGLAGARGQSRDRR